MGPNMEKELVNASLGGDRGAYAELVKMYSKKVFAVCLGILGNVEDAEDLGQDTFIRAYGCLGQLRDKEYFGTWIKKIARNLCIDHVRREARRRKVETEHEFDRGIGDDHDELREVIMELPEDLRIPLLVYYFDGRSSESVADMLQLSKAGVLTRLSRARKELRKLLTEREHNV